jgi:hypothetical protein
MGDDRIGEAVLRRDSAEPARLADLIVPVPFGLDVDCAQDVVPGRVAAVVVRR